MIVLKLTIFCLILIYASAIDIKTRLVPTQIHVLLLFTGLIGVNMQSLIGLLITGLPLLIAWSITSAFGGGDVKLGAMCGFVLQAYGGITALMIGATLAVIVVPIICIAKHKKISDFSFPFIPFIAVGGIVASITTLI